MVRTERLLSYSVAIRTLGLAGEAFRRGLQSIAMQTVRPERVVVYVADDFEVDFRDESVCGER